jgi:Holliday junction resolvase RusA-like endonuclease
MTITVYGTPAPQGSKRHVGKGIMVESSEKVKPWREAVKYAAIGNMEPFIGAVRVSIVFTIQKPKSAPKKWRTYPDRKPDIDKLVRSTFDALTDVGVFEDDARVVELTASKVFPGEGERALTVPGAVITVEAIRA